MAEMTPERDGIEGAFCGLVIGIFAAFFIWTERYSMDLVHPPSLLLCLLATASPVFCLALLIYRIIAKEKAEKPGEYEGRVSK